MQYSIVKDLLGKPWQVEATTFQRFFPLAAGALNGAEFTIEPEPVENKPFAISANTGAKVLTWSTNEEPLDDEPTDDDDSILLEKVIHVLPVRDIMVKHDMLCGPAGTRTLAKRLREADVEESVIGHIVVFETGGGSADSVPELAEAITACTKPVVAWVDGIMCSAGMYAGSYCNEIIASRPTDRVGCIGTLVVFEGRKAVSEEDEDRVIHLRIYADDATQKNEEYEKAINDLNFKLTKDHVLNPANTQFVSDIKKNRPGVEDEHLHGRTFEAAEVVGALVDSIGSFDYAAERVIALSGYTPVQEPANNTNSNSKLNNVKMELPRMQNVMGYESLEFEADGRRTFTIEEMEAIEAALGQASNEAEIQRLTAQVQEGASEIERLGSQLSQASEDALANNARIEELTSEASTLREENASLRQTPAATTAPAATDREPVAGSQTVQVSEQHEGFLEKMNAVAKEYLGKETI